MVPTLFFEKFFSFDFPDNPLTRKIACKINFLDMPNFCKFPDVFPDFPDISSSSGSLDSLKTKYDLSPFYR